MTETPDMETLRYPVGRFEPGPHLDPRARERAMENIAATPANLRRAVAGLTPEQLNTPYRPDGWTIRQVVHHVPDSHLNGYMRFKLGLTEEVPTIRTYEEAAWAELPDSFMEDIEVSLALLESLHERWVVLLEALTPEDWHRTVFHPEMNAEISLDALLQLYDWHGRHHVAHITGLRDRKGW